MRSTKAALPTSGPSLSLQDVPTVGLAGILSALLCGELTDPGTDPGTGAVTGPERELQVNLVSDMMDGHSLSGVTADLQTRSALGAVMAIAGVH